MIQPGDFARVLATIGRARVFVRPDSLLAAGALAELGVTEGAIRAEIMESAQVLTTPEITGEIVHRKRTKPLGISVALPMVVDMQALATINARPSTTGQDDPTFGMMVVPEDQLGGGLTLAAGTWTPALPTRALFIFKGTFGKLPIIYQDENVGKYVETVTFTGHWYDPNPTGLEVYAFGSEITAVTALAV